MRSEAQLVFGLDVQPPVSARDLEQPWRWDDADVRRIVATLVGNRDVDRLIALVMDLREEIDNRNRHIEDLQERLASVRSALRD